MPKPRDLHAGEEPHQFRELAWVNARNALDEAQYQIGKISESLRVTENEEMAKTWELLSELIDAVQVQGAKLAR